MNQRPLGKNGFNISEVGLGCWQLGSDWGEGIEKEKAFAILQQAVDSGITFFDTADVYGGGKSETLIGAFFQQNKTPVKITTKYGRTADVYPNNYTEDSLRKAVEASLKRLQMDCLDLIQLHCIPMEALKSGEIFDALRKLKEEGLIAHFGASVESVEQGLVCLEQEGLQSLQIIYNIFRQKLTTDLLPQAQAKGVGLIVRLPLASGLLTGKFTQETTFHESDHRNYNRDGQAFNVGETFAGLPFEKGVELAQQLEGMRPKGTNMVQMALRWILDHEAVSTIIPGASLPRQVAQNAAISDLESLSPSLMTKLTDFYQTHVQDHIRGVY
ncbi:MAG: aldo/keto reductase [Bacteroidota bacterium]